MTFDFDLWLTDLTINRDHLLTKDYLPTKFEASGAKRSGVISCTRLRATDIPTDRHVQRNMPLLLRKGWGARKKHDRPNNAGNVKTGDFNSSGNFFRNDETTLLGNYEYTCTYWLFSNQNLLIRDKGSQHFMVKNTTCCNFVTFSHPLQCVEWSASLRKFDLNGNLEFNIKEAQICIKLE